MERSKVKLLVDAAMTLALLLLMPYELIGTLPHEIIGTGMLLLFITHHILNRKWTAGMFRGRYTALRSVQTAVILLMFLCVLGSGFSGILLSKHLYKALPDVPFSSLSRNRQNAVFYFSDFSPLRRGEIRKTERTVFD